MAARLAVEIAGGARVGALSRLAGRGGGTTLPGKLLWRSTRRDRPLAARLPLGVGARLGDERQDDDRGDGRRDPRPRARRPQRLRARTSSRASPPTLLAARDAELGLFEVDEGALPEVPAACGRARSALGNLFRDQLDRYGELELVAERWRDAVAALAADDAARRQRRRPAGRRARARARAARCRSASTTRGTPGRRSSTRPTRRTASLRNAVRLRRRVRRPSRRLPLPGVRPRAAAARRRRTRDRAARARRACVHARRRRTARGAFELAAAGALQRLQRARGSVARAGARGRPRRDRGGPRALLGGLRPVRADRDRRPAGADAADQEPGRRERGGADARSTARRRAWR